MAEDVEAELAALEANAPVTPESHEIEVDAPEGQADAAPDGAPGADDWKPPSRETYENVQKALRAEREAKRVEARRAAQYEKNIQLMQERFENAQAQQLAARLQQPAPDPYENPEGARRWAEETRQFQQQLWQAERQREQAARAQEQQARQFEHLSSAVEDYEAEFKSASPDYDDAAEHVLATQEAFLVESGMSKRQAEQQVAMWSAAVAQQAVNAGRDPAKMVYDMARRMGYVSKDQRQAQVPAQAAADRLEAIRAGQKSAVTLTGGGANTSGTPSLKQIASLSGAAFDSAFDAYLNKAIRGS